MLTLSDACPILATSTVFDPRARPMAEPRQGA